MVLFISFVTHLHVSCIISVSLNTLLEEDKGDVCDALSSVAFFNSLLLLFESSDLSAKSCDVELASSTEEAAATFMEDEPIFLSLSSDAFGGCVSGSSVPSNSSSCTDLVDGAMDIDDAALSFF